MSGYTFEFRGAGGESGSVTVAGPKRWYRRWAMRLAVRLWAWATAPDRQPPTCSWGDPICHKQGFVTRIGRLWCLAHADEVTKQMEYKP